MFFAICGITGVFFILLYFYFGNRVIYLGYRSIEESSTTRSSLQKKYGSVKVDFFNWGSITSSSIRHGSASFGMPDGIYATISSPFELKINHAGELFDEVEYDSAEMYVITAKKKGVFIGEPEMKLFLDRFELRFMKDLEMSGESIFVDETSSSKKRTSGS